MTDTELIPVGPGREEGTAPEEGIAQLDVEITPDHPHGGERAEGAEEGGGSASVADIEALLFVAERPLTRAELRALAKLSADEVDERLGDLEVQLRDRGIRLISNDDHVMLGTSPESGPLIARYLGADAVRLSPAALETLAIIAYRQPVTRGVIERIRGVDSGHVVRGLLHRRLVHEQGRAETPGRPILYGTSMEFMERFGLTSLDDLPPLEAEIAAQLAQAEEDARAEVGAAKPEGDGPSDDHETHRVGSGDSDHSQDSEDDPGSDDAPRPASDVEAQDEVSTSADE